MIFEIVRRTPVWVWGLLAALLALGFSQLGRRTVRPRRVFIMPLAMLGFALAGIVTDLSRGGHPAAPLLAWALAAGVTTLLLAPFAPPAGTQFDAAANTFTLPGSYQPLLLIVGIFLTKYVVGIELAMQPALATDLGFTLPVSLLYGLFSGIFAARALRLWRMTFTHTPALAPDSAPRWRPRPLTQRDPW